MKISNMEIKEASKKYCHNYITIFNEGYIESSDYGIDFSRIRLCNIGYSEYLDEMAKDLYKKMPDESYLLVWVRAGFLMNRDLFDPHGWRSKSVWVSGPSPVQIGLLYKKDNHYTSRSEKFIVDNGSGMSSSKVCVSILDLCSPGEAILNISQDSSSLLATWANRNHVFYYGFVEDDDDAYNELILKASQLEIPETQMSLV